jgi:hypothetical protein
VAKCASVAKYSIMELNASVNKKLSKRLSKKLGKRLGKSANLKDGWQLIDFRKQN